jgi:PAS domain S-box-containing protein
MNSNKEISRSPKTDKEKQQQLKEKVEYLSEILHRSNEMIAAIDTDFRLVTFNNAFQKRFKPLFKQELYPGILLEEALDAEVLAEQRSMWERALKGEEFTYIIRIFLHQQQKSFEFSFSGIRNGDGKIIGASQHIQDITAAVSIPQEQSPLQEFSLLANTMPQFVWSSWMDGRPDFINERLSQFTGLSLQVLLQKGWQACLHPEDLPLYLKKLETFRQEKEPFEAEFRIQSKDGSYRWFICKAVPIVYNNNNEVSKYLCTATDIHEQKQLLEKLEQKAKELEHITEAIPQLVWTSDASGRHIYFNRRWFDYTGFDLSQSMAEGWLLSLHPDDRSRTLEAWNHSLASGDPYKIEYRFKKYDGTYRWFIGQAVPLHDNEGKIVRWFGTCTDIHDQKTQRDELDQKNQKLFQINRYLDEFVHAVAHDLRSPVAGLKLSFELLNQVDEKKQENILNGCQTYLNRLDNTLKGLVQLIEVQEDPARTHHEEIDILQLIQQVMIDLQEKLQQANASVKNEDFQWRTIRYPKPYIYNILRNIIRYALRFRNPDKPLAFKISTQQQNGLMRIRIEENGPGINLEKEMKNLFKPFSHINKGSDKQGMGLAIVKHMVEKNGGNIQVESSLGEGTKFDVYLKEYTQEQ